jgi:succinate-semialdehyde dehydrogenase/glutarate-semialdehyde dehydrogenase
MGLIQHTDGSTNGSTTNGGANGATAGRDGARTIKSWAPATGELLGEVRISSKEEVRAAVARARKAQAAWGVLPIEERCERLLRLRDATRGQTPA